MPKRRVSGKRVKKVKNGCPACGRMHHTGAELLACAVRVGVGEVKQP